MAGLVAVAGTVLGRRWERTAFAAAVAVAMVDVALLLLLRHRDRLTLPPRRPAHTAHTHNQKQEITDPCCSCRQCASAVPGSGHGAADEAAVCRSTRQ
ncbi:hypothetical protein [Streptomyces avermitilis]|uniref:hypothetical protein n=1 Tax=Streptomyces avermitilis TaxID=33903 RepID=UPI0033BA0EA9